MVFDKNGIPMFRITEKGVILAGGNQLHGEPGNEAWGITADRNDGSGTGSVDGLRPMEIVRFVLLPFGQKLVCAGHLTTSIKVPEARSIGYGGITICQDCKRAVWVK